MEWARQAQGACTPKRKSDQSETAQLQTRCPQGRLLVWSTTEDPELKSKLLSTLLGAGVVAAATFASGAHALDEGSDTKKAPAAAPSAGSDSKDQSSAVMKGTVIGTVQLKKVSQGGRDVSVPEIRVLAAEDKNGRSVEGAEGMVIRVTGPKAREVARMAGKQVRLAGPMVPGKEIAPESFAEVKPAGDGSDTKSSTPKKPTKTSEGSDTK